MTALSTKARLAIDIPDRMKSLQKNSVGYVIPWFIRPTDDGSDPDFRILDARRMQRALSLQLCLLCGQRMGRYASFIIGPMCTVNLISAETPNHLECAEYAVRVCPFLANPNMVRPDRPVPEGSGVAGTMIARNPGVTAIWTTREWFPMRAPNGVLFNIGPRPTSVSWWRESRPATHDEVMEAMKTGLPALIEVAEAQDAEEGGSVSVDMLTRQTQLALSRIPRA